MNKQMKWRKKYLHYLDISIYNNAKDYCILQVILRNFCNKWKGVF